MLVFNNNHTEPQPRRQVMKKNTIFVGLDVHKNSETFEFCEKGVKGFFPDKN